MLLENITNIIVALAAFGTFCIAFKGLNSWKQQFKAKLILEECTKLTESIYRVRDELEFTRGFAIHASEFPEWYNSLPPNEISHEQEADAHWHMFSKRFEPLSQAIREMESTVPKVEALIGCGAKEAVREIIKVCGAHRTACQAYIGNIKSGYKEASKEQFNKYREKAFDSPKDIPNAFTQKINEVINIAAEYLQKEIDKALG